MTKIAFTFFLMAWSATAAISVSSIQTTNTQAAITFSESAGNVGSCTLAASESSSLAPLVHDIDSSIFTGADQVGRDSGNLMNGTTATFVVGKKVTAYATAGDTSKKYSRALQQDTTHYFQIRCPVSGGVAQRYWEGIGSYTDARGNVWSHDPGGLWNCNSGCYTFSTRAAIAGTSDPSLYQAARQSYGPTMTYTNASLADGNYQVTLKFAEIQFPAMGQQVFNIVANGKAIQSGFDENANGSNQASDVSFPVTISGGAGLTISINQCCGSNHAPGINAWSISSIATDTYTGTFRTRTIGLGNTYPDLIPVDATQPGMPLWPSISWNDPHQTIIDPQTGVLIKRMGMPTDMTAWDPYDLFWSVNAPAWSSAANVLKSGASAASISGSTAALAVATPCWTSNGVCGRGADPGSGGNTSVFRSRNMGDTWPIKMTAYFSASISNNSCDGSAGEPADCYMDFCVTLNGVTCAPNARTYQFPLSSAVTAYCAGADCASGPGQGGGMYDVMQVSGKRPWNHTETSSHDGELISCDGSTTLTHVWTGDSFLTDYLVPGSQIITDAGIFTVSSVLNAMKVVATTACPTGTYVYWGSNFGFLVWKQTSSADTLSVNGLHMTALGSQQPMQLIYGGVQASKHTVTCNGGDPCSIFNWANSGSSAGVLYALDLITGDTIPFSDSKFYNYGGIEGLPWDAVTGTGYTIDGGNIYSWTYSGTYGAPSATQLTGFGTGTSPLFESGGNSQVPACGTPPCWNKSQITQTESLSSLLSDFDNRFPTNGSFNPAALVEVVQNPANGHAVLIIEINYRGRQMGTWEWMTVFDPSLTSNGQPGNAGCVSARDPGQPGCFIAAVPEWQTPGMRWQNVKEGGPAVMDGWASWGLFYTSGGVAQFGIASVPATITCPASAGSGTCYQFTRDGLPYDSNVGVSGRGDLGDIAAGDYILGNNSWPGYTVVGVNGNTVTVICYAGNTNCQSLSNGMTLEMVTNLYSSWTAPWNGYALNGTVLWDWVDDPHGGNANGATVITDYSSFNSHSIFSNNYFLTGNGNQYGDVVCQQSNVPWGCYDSQNLQGQSRGAIAKAFSKDSFLNFTDITANFNSFGGVFGYHGDASGNSIQSHPDLANFSTGHDVLDGRPFVGVENWPSGQNVVNKGGDLYQITLPAALNRKIVPTWASSGVHVLRDISGPSSAIDGTPAHSYEYCIVNADNECQPGSHSGDIFANVPQYLGTGIANFGGCYFNDGGYAGATTDIWFQNDLCLMDSGPEAGRLVKYTPNGLQLDGRQMQYLTHGFNYGRATVFYETYAAENSANIPGGNHWYFWQCAYCDQQGGTATMLLKAPRAAQETTNRTTFEPVNVSLSAPSGDTVAVEFGYQEMGGYCTSRQETCVAAGRIHPHFSASLIYEGASNYTDSAGNTWTPDNGSWSCQWGCFSYATTNAISGTPDQILYQKALNPWGSSMTYSNPSLSNGTYQITLKFAQIQFSGPGQQVFDIIANGSAIRTAMDLYTAGGNMNNVAVDVTFTVTTGAGGLTINLNQNGGYHGPEIAGYQVIQTASTQGPTEPFYYETTEASTWAGTPCTPNCKISLPALPGSFVYYRPLILDSTGRIIARGAQQIASAP